MNGQKRFTSMGNSHEERKILTAKEKLPQQKKNSHTHKKNSHRERKIVTAK